MSVGDSLLRRATVLCGLLVAVNSAYGEGPTGLIALPNQSVCTGFDTEKKSWGLVGIAQIDEEESRCPSGYAFLAARNSAGPARPLANYDFRGTCCPLPPNSLTDQHLFVEEGCPDSYVATGLKQDLSDPALDGVAVPSMKKLSDQERLRYFPYARKFSIRCTKIDSERFVLGHPDEGVSVGWYRHLRTMFEKRITRSHLPLELRYGLGRVGQYEWAQLFCVGQRPGAVLISKGRKACSEFKFRELLYRGAPGDPEAGTKALVYNRCLYLEDELGTEPRCIGELK